MSQQLTRLLETVQVTDPREVGGLQVFGLRWEGSNGLVYRTLDEEPFEVLEVAPLPFPASAVFAVPDLAGSLLLLQPMASTRAPTENKARQRFIFMVFHSPSARDSSL